MTGEFPKKHTADTNFGGDNVAGSSPEVSDHLQNTTPTELSEQKVKEFFHLATTTYQHDLPYHNLEHMRHVYDRLIDITKHVRAGVLVQGYDRYEKEFGVPEGGITEKNVRNYLLIAAAFHDAFHEGNRFRQEKLIKVDIADGIDHVEVDIQALQELGLELSVDEFDALSNEQQTEIRQALVGGDMPSTEEFSAKMMRTLLADDLKDFELKIIEDMILATTFGQADETLPSWRQRHYKPQTPAERLLILADLGSFMGGAENLLIQSVLVKEEEAMHDPEVEMYEDVSKMSADVVKGFINMAAEGALTSCESFLQPAYYNGLRSRLDQVKRDALELVGTDVEHALQMLSNDIGDHEIVLVKRYLSIKRALEQSRARIQERRALANMQR